MLVDVTGGNREIENESAIGREMASRGRDAFARVDEVVEANVGERGQPRHRVEGAEDHQIVLIAAVVQERARIIINGTNAIGSIRLIGMKLAAEVEDDRVDLDGVDIDPVIL